jgi:2'-5' RNA ligase
VRCFLAVDLPEAVREAIAAVQARLAADLDRRPAGDRVRWVAAANLHLTLRFLGEIDEVGAGQVTGVVERVAAEHAPIAVEAAGLGLFTGPVRPRVVWVGLTAGSPDVGRLARSLEEALATVGFAPEPRPFRAHLTIGRIRPGRTMPDGRVGGGGRIRPGGRGGLADALSAAGAPRFGGWTVRDVVLYRSYLGPRGPRYEALRRFSLAGATPA